MSTWQGYNPNVGISDTLDSSKLRDAPSVADTSRRGFSRSGGISSMDECIEFDGFRNPLGYGLLYHGGRRWLAHRFAWTQTIGPIPDGLCVLHRCDNPPCVNVDHLWLGTRVENNADMKAKGRARSGGLQGSRIWSARLTEADIPVIRSRLAGGELQREVAADYGVTQSAISMAVRGRRWSHVLSPVRIVGDGR